ncbi:NAD(P)H-hydrate dehydratase [Ahrensia marina]|uniref:NAD(P)H-hydrate dehydratase n=1 Tax=Ahrensia marina TaxID=1514904 RepID=UPI0035D11382
MRELLTPAQMGACDAFTINHGTPGIDLMERAGQAVADVAKAMTPKNGRVLVLAGPGKNGGDGYVAARLLASAGYDVRVAALGDTRKLEGDAKWAFDGWNGDVLPATELDTSEFAAYGLILDALFGAGLTRGLDGAAAALVQAVNHAEKPVLAVDLPSGLDGRKGQALGPAVQATSTVTFHRLKPGHLLYPGRALCGAIRVADIGIHHDAISAAGFTAQLTGAYLTEHLFDLSADAHKYARGHVLVIGGPPEKAGAGFLSASVALRAGTGLVTLALPPETMAGSVGQYPALMRARCADARDLARLLRDDRLTACALGPGLTPNEATRQMVYAALDSKTALVLDAGAITAFAGMVTPLFERIMARSAPTVLTPHSGEFKRLFGDSETNLSKIERAQKAARGSGAILVLKGADTVIAHPNGRADCTYVNANAPPWLATAGSGDVLAGIVAGLLAQPDTAHNDPQHQTATVALGVWLHGEAGQPSGPALVATDLEAALQTVLQRVSPSQFIAVQG